MGRKGNQRGPKHKRSSLSRRVLSTMSPDEMRNLHRTADDTHIDGATFREGGKRVDLSFVPKGKHRPSDLDIVIPAGMPMQDVLDAANNMHYPQNIDQAIAKQGYAFASKPTVGSRQPIIDESYSGGFEVTPKGVDLGVLLDADKRLRQHKQLHRHHLLALLAQYQQTSKGLHSDAWVDALIEAARHSELFNFGFVPNDELVIEAFKAINVMGTGMIRAPYSMCVYSHSSQLGSDYFHSFYVIMDGAYDSLLPLRGKGAVDKSFHIIELRAGITKSDKLSFAVRGGVSTDYVRKPSGDYTMHVFANPLKLTDDELKQEVVSICDPVAIFTLAINTKNLVMERIEIEPKLNKARARQNKPPLLPYTVVYMHKYAEAARATRHVERGGTHASPCPHLRRAHWRYKDHPTIKPQWIEQCIVNAHMGAPVKRDEYRVRK